MRTPTGRARHAALVVAAAALLLAPAAIGTARAQQPSATDRAREHFTRGKQLFASGDYRAAIAEFAEADSLAPSPLLEFNIALCHERLGERPEAVRRYKLYLERVPDAANRAEVEAKVSRLEAEIKSEAESKKKAAPPPLVPPPVGPSGPDVAPPATAPAPTGDPELDRAARIDVKRLRAKRQAAGEGPPPAAQGRAGPPPSEPPPRPPPAKDTGEKKSKPIYKQWWFWVVAGVSAIIIVSIATSDSDPDDGRARILPFGDAKSDMAQPGGAVLLRF